MQNALVEFFNGRFRDECLNENLFFDLPHARIYHRSLALRLQQHPPTQQLTREITKGVQQIARTISVSSLILVGTSLREQVKRTLTITESSWCN